MSREEETYMASYYHPENYKNSESLLNVQELVKKPLASVPQRYIRLSQESPTIPDDIRGLEIPSIDIKQLVLEETNEAELEKLHSACRNLGIFQLVNHGVSSQMLEKLKNETEKFFDLSLEEKMKYKIRPGDVEGYGRVITSEGQRLDWSDRFYMTTNPLHKRKPHIFPELPSSLRSILESYMVELQRLAMTLLGLLAKSLKMKTREMEELFEDGMQSVRMTYYPPCPQPELVMGITEHSDATGITILNQINGVDGLQIKKDGVWIPVKFQSDALVVNIGDILEIMSNGAYTSVEHRAMVNSNKERISIAMFFNPKLEAEIGPAISLTNPQNPPLFKRTAMEKYVKDNLSRKLDGKFNIENMRIKTEEAANAMRISSLARTKRGE